MKKISLVIAFTLVAIIPSIVSAETNIKGYVTSNDTLIAKTANVTVSGCLNKVNGSYNSNYVAPGKLHCLDSGEEVKILNYDSIIKSTISACKNGYYKTQYTTTSGVAYTGYVCADKISTSINTDKYASELKNFPASYKEKLTLLKNNHPNWIFTAYNTGVDWDAATKAESVVGMSYIQSTNPIYLSLDEGSYNKSTGTYIQKEVGGFYAANKATVAYYMDPRNFLDEMNIFQFENLGYNSTYQTKTVVDSVVSGTGLSSYSNYFVEAATYNGNNVSPVYLAARSRQEVVKSDKTLSNSANGSKGYYNFYNLGAWSSCSNPIDCAIDFASGYGGSYKTYNRPWKTAESAIKNGAKYIAEGYINVKQNTLYFQKWDVVNYNGNYNHQYMTNIKAAVTEGKNTWSSYKNMDVLKNPIQFVIPIYNNMPTSSSTLPIKVETPTNNSNSNSSSNSSTSTTSQAKAISTMITSAGYKYNGNYLKNVGVGTTASKMINNLKNTGASVTIKTTNSSGVTKTISSNEKLGTGDTVTISNGTTSGTYRIVVIGDTNGDGIVNAIDYVKLYKYVYKNSSNLTGSYKEAADMNQDGKVNAIDYVKLYKLIR